MKRRKQCQNKVQLLMNKSNGLSLLRLLYARGAQEGKEADCTNSALNISLAKQKEMFPSTTLTDNFKELNVITRSHYLPFFSHH